MPPSATSPTIEMPEPALYQVDCCVAASGKTVSASKRRVIWRYGFANPDALANGAVGVEARGSEQEITLIWSITSGKKKVTHNGREVHYSQGRRAEGKFQFSWQAQNHVFNLVAFAAPPRVKTNNGSQFQLYIDGCSFNKLTRIFELGLGSKRQSGHVRYGNEFARKVPRSAPSAFAPIENREFRSPENTYGSRSPHSIEYVRHMNNESPQSLLATENVTAPPSPQDLLGDNQTNSVVTDLLSSATPATVDFHVQTNTHPHSSSPFEYEANDEFNPVAPPSHEVVWSNIMSAYDCPDDNNLQHPMVSRASSAASDVDASMHNLAIDTTMRKTAQGEGPLDSPTEVTAMNSMEKLVNLDDISAPVFQTYSQTKSKANSMAGKEHLPLAALKSEINKNGKTQSTREIMKTHNANVPTHAHAHAAGQLVVYGAPPGQQMYNNYAPPPISHGAFR